MTADTLKKLSEVAVVLNTSLSNVYSLVSQGRLPIVRTGANGKGYRVVQADLERFIEEGKKGRRIAPSSEKLRPFKRLKGDRLRDSWKRQGIRVDQQDGDSARSS
jgi:excisionase family DNA binding protein